MNTTIIKHEFQSLKEFYACAKCQTQEITIPILLKTCRHIFCTRCIIIRDKQACPKCQETYSSNDVDRGNKFLTDVLHSIKELDEVMDDLPLNITQEDFDSIFLDTMFDGIFQDTIDEPDNAIMDETSNKNITKNIGELSITSGSDSSDSQEPVVETTAEVHVESSQVVSKQKRISQGPRDKMTIFDVQIANNKTQKGLEEANSSIASNYTDPAITQIPVEFEIEESFKNVVFSTVITKRNPKGETQLHLACKKGNVDHVKFLLEANYDVNCVDWANWTPLHEAVQIGSYDCVELLLQAGCLVNVPAQNYTTPLHQATETKMKAICAALVAYGGDMNAMDLNGNTPKGNCDEDLLKHLTNVKVSKEAQRKLVFNCDSSKSGPKRTQTTEARLLKLISVSEGLEYLPLPDSYDNDANTAKGLTRLFVSHVMAALLKAVPIVYVKDVSSLLTARNMAYLQLIPTILRAAYKKSLLNRLYRRPKLFDGMHIHLPLNILKYKVNNVLFTKEDLQGLIEIGGGTMLRRAPTESTVEGVTHRPYHCQHSKKLENCSHFIVYDHEAPPLLLYNMKELRHVSAAWLLECIWHFKLTSETCGSQTNKFT